VTDGRDWRYAYERHEELTPAQTCRSYQDTNHPSRVTFCARCGHATGSYQGHYWKWCRKKPGSAAAIGRGQDNGVEFHTCCPGSCSLTDPDPDPIQPCHPALGTYEEWAAGVLAERANMEVWRDMVDEGNRADGQGR
jgi:hypothetical protein